MKTYPIVCASVASNPSKLGVKLHMAGYESLGLEYNYVAIGAENIQRIVQAVKDLPIRGLGVSMPFKEDIIKELDDLDFSVKKIGACNTVVNNNGILTGYNTDWVGAIEAIKETVNIDSIRRAVIVGAGGVARAIAFGLRQYNIDVYVCARNKTQADRLANDLSLQGTGSIEQQGDFFADMVINATPISDENSPVNLSVHKKARILFDVAFQHRETKLMKAAHENGLLVVPGWRMLLYQGMEQFKLYTKQIAPIEAMSKVLEEALPR